MIAARALAAASVALLLAACATPGGTGPRARIAEPAGLEAGRTLAGAPVSPAVWPRADWWKGLADPQLDALVEEALADGPSLRIAQARLDRARGLARVAGATRFPQLGAGADVSRQRFSENGIFPPPIGGSSFTQYQLAANLGWDLDPWGRNRALYESALGQARAAEIDAFAARLVVSAGVAHAYVHLQRTFEQLDLARRALEERQETLRLTQQRLAAGLDSRVELKQVETAVPAARARVLQLEEELALVRNQIAALLGKGPDRGLAIERPAAHPQDLALPSTLPADLVGRRPDVIAQRWRVEAARRDVAAAKAQFYPDVNLSALVGVQSIALSKLLESGSAIPSAGAALRLPLFEGGRLRGNLAARDADYDLAVEQYNQTLVDALREVVDQLASLRSIGAQRVEAEAALAAAEEAYQLALARYRAGLGGLLQVLIAETQVLEERSLAADLRARELDSGIDLARALGGGFEDERPLPVAARSSAP
jgi:NodT family efflux transporter outer membrane factor (OMF) lipoprotein